MSLWGHPTSLLAAPSRAPLNTHTSNCAALFRLPTKQLRNVTSSSFQAPNETVTQRIQHPFLGSQPNIYEKLSAVLFRAPRDRSPFIPTNHGLVYSDQSQTTHQPSKPNKRRPPGASKTKVTRDPALKAEVNRLQRSVTRRLNEWRNDQWSTTLESLNPEDQSLWKMTKRVMRVPTPSTLLVTPGGIALSDSEKA